MEHIDQFLPYCTVCNKLAEASGVTGFELPNFPEWIKVCVVYPFGTVAARVYFKDEGDKTNAVSAYYDVLDQLGRVGQPYFEIYPGYTSGETARFLYHEQAKMYETIIAILTRKRKA